jgi:16S rRNA A1518/A1519 N6-dimethyltransferase RsmA/KsgA/DIM1 with predicted DNA glycosylase/AP lyase activity
VSAAGLDPQQRGEQLAVTDFARIAEALSRPEVDSGPGVDRVTG